MNHGLPAADPRSNAAVLASAGTGKTWLLVTRMVRLLLSGARPEGILALTFTRKAAAEMLARLNQRLKAYAGLDDAALTVELDKLDVVADAEQLQRARSLYEQMLFAERPLRATTFHAFCQEVLQRFPLEADIPPDFELLDSSTLLAQQAMEALLTEATRSPDEAIARALEILLDRCGGLYNTQAALTSFLQHRSDWWAFSEDQTDAVADARSRIAELLEVDADTDALHELKQHMGGALRECMDLLIRHETRANQDAAACIERWLASEAQHAQDFADLRRAFFTQQNSRRKRSASKAQCKSLGEPGELRLLELHDRLCECIERADDIFARIHNLELNGAWYVAGQRMLEHFQRLKREQRLLDFTDLEWRAYRLLNRADNAHWVQYKLDQRIDHLLIDEFQDTNPTQWQLLAPLLEELAAGAQDRFRSVFLVGDDKQSIYRFRRAEPQLLQNAAAWLQQRMDARIDTLEKSWRSSPAVITCVNAVFEGPLAGKMPSYRHHDTHRAALWGAVEVLPLIHDAPAEPQALPPGLRNPLRQPRQVAEDQRHYREGQQVASRIAELMNQQTTVHVDGRTRPLCYDDVFILMRKRTHAAAIERALREAGIPYLGAGRGTLLESLEVSDMEALLTVLTMPYDDLALAQVLRAPLFSVSDEDLLLVGERAHDGTWRAALDELAARNPQRQALLRAQRLLNGWENIAGRVPVHDLLDRIYHEANVPARYEAAYPAALRPRVRANLARFISLALEVDSGRYPSLPNFITRLRQLRRNALDAPDEPPAESGEARVRLLTIHAAKGLEAPVVFVVDCAASESVQRANRALVHWPADQNRPSQFLLTTSSRWQDRATGSLLQQEQEAERREDLNLLYVALTRARQYLFISASAPRKGAELGWYGRVRDGLAALVEADRDGVLALAMGEAPPIDPPPPSAPSQELPADVRLSQEIGVSRAAAVIQPSNVDVGAGSPEHSQEDGRPRGIALHKLLELLTAGIVESTAGHRAAAEVGLPADAEDVAQWLAEAKALLHEPTLAHLFAPQCYEQAFNEVPLQFNLDERPVSGIIDRLVVTKNEVLIVDYKTHRLRDERDAEFLAATFEPQLRLYAEGTRRLWPQRKVRAFLLFTHDRRLHEIQQEAPGA